VRSQRGGGVERGGRVVAQLDWACRMAWISPFVSQAVYSPVSVMGVSPTTWRDIRSETLGHTVAANVKEVGRLPPEQTDGVRLQEPCHKRRHDAEGKAMTGE